MTEPTNVIELATGLRFPEGPVCLPDGSVLYTELVDRRRINRIQPDGTVEVVAEPRRQPQRPRHRSRRCALRVQQRRVRVHGSRGPGAARSVLPARPLRRADRASRSRYR